MTKDEHKLFWKFYAHDVKHVALGVLKSPFEPDIWFDIRVAVADFGRALGLLLLRLLCLILYPLSVPVLSAVAAYNAVVYTRPDVADGFDHEHSSL